MKPIITTPTIQFLKGLKTNNKKEWMDQHREEYKMVRQEFVDFVTLLIHDINTFYSLKHVEPKECIFRINRDIRFSHNKTPYKPHFGACIAPKGKKFPGAAFYLKVSGNDDSYIGAGSCDLSNESLHKIRLSLSQDPKEFKGILKKLPYQIHGDQLKSAPRGFSKEDPAIDLIRFKNYFVGDNASNQIVLDNNFYQHCLKEFKKLVPFLNYINQFVSS